jgi:putative component of membrane protein insertase Oxa1/YidC/SpoIIIJ protein YidD
MCTAIAHWGIVRGVFLGCRRIAKCHPWHQGNIVDFVPENPNKIKATYK